MTTRRSAEQASRFSPIGLAPGPVAGWKPVQLWLALLIAIGSARAQSYSIDWSTLDGGGGTSTGGAYSVSGTIGQPDAGGTMTGGNYSVAGGFWSLLSVFQAPDTPALRIVLTSTNTVLVFWPSHSADFVLHQNTGLDTTNWTAPLENVNDNGTNKFIIVNPPVDSRFYRLFKY